MTRQHLCLNRHLPLKKNSLARTDPGADLGEISEVVFIRTTSISEAVAWGEAIAEVFVQMRFGQEAYSWRSLEFASWLEENPALIAWAHENEAPILESSREIDTVARQMAHRKRIDK